MPTYHCQVPAYLTSPQPASPRATALHPRLPSSSLRVCRPAILRSPSPVQSCLLDYIIHGALVWLNLLSSSSFVVCYGRFLLPSVFTVICSVSRASRRPLSLNSNRPSAHQTDVSSLPGQLSSSSFALSWYLLDPRPPFGARPL